MRGHLSGSKFSCSERHLAFVTRDEGYVKKSVVFLFKPSFEEKRPWLGIWPRRAMSL